ncbi:hypothetical protein HDU98_002651, partial [Podochytrium sp. JEL0797]
MSEFRGEALVSELLCSLGVSSSEAAKHAALLSSSNKGREGGAPRGGAVDSLGAVAAVGSLLPAAERAGLLRRFEQLRHAQVSSLGAFVDLARRIRSDAAVVRMVSTSTSANASSTSSANASTTLANNTSTPRGRTAASSASGFIGQRGSLLSSTPQTSDAFATPQRRPRAASTDAFKDILLSTISTQNSTLLNASSRMRRSASASRTIKKQSSSKSLSQDDARLKSLLPPLACRLPKQQPSTLHSTTIPPIGSLNIKSQEDYILEDLLYILQGIDGIYIKQSTPTLNPLLSTTTASLSFHIDPSLDPSLASLTTRILPLATSHHHISRFIDSHSSFDHGKVAHALSAALRSILSDYLTLVAQLEHQVRFAPGGFGLQKVWYHVLPSIHLLGLVEGLVDALLEAERVDLEEGNGGRGGGVVLGVIADKVLTMSGDATAKKTFTHLLSLSSRPYFQTLHTWIHHGQINDPYHEFLVQERPGMNKSLMTKDFNDGYWEQRYTLRNVVPCFLEGCKEKVLLAGKYWNVVRECGIEVGEVGEGRKVKGFDGEGEGKVAAFGDVVRVVDDGRFVQDIEKAYRFANQTLLELLFEGNHLVDRLRSLKHYLLLDQSDFLTHFLDLGTPELHKPSSTVSLETLTSMLELVLRNPGSVSALDPYKDDITVELSHTSLVEQLLRVTSVVGVDYRDVFVEAEDGSTLVDMSRVNLGMGAAGAGAGESEEKELRGIDAFTLGYNATFPVSLIINKRVVTKYQLLFRHLLHCKTVERMLTDVWVDKAKFLRQRRWVGVKSKRAVAMAAAKRAAASTGGGGVRRQGSVQSLQGENSSNKAARVPVVEEGPKMTEQEEREETAFLNRVSVVQGRMLMFVQQFLHFICFDVIEPSWRVFEAELVKVTTVEEVLKIHNDFLDTCLKDCLLTNQKLLKHFGSLMKVCTDFSLFANAFLLERFGSLNPRDEDDDENDTPPAPPPSIQFASLSSTSDASRTLQQFEDAQIASMREFIHALQFAESMSGFESLTSTSSVMGGVATTAVLQDLVTRIDFNLFYSRVFLGGVGLGGAGAGGAGVKVGGGGGGGIGGM